MYDSSAFITIFSILFRPKRVTHQHPSTATSPVPSPCPSKPCPASVVGSARREWYLDTQSFWHSDPSANRWLPHPRSQSTWSPERKGSLLAMNVDLVYSTSKPAQSNGIEIPKSCSLFRIQRQCRLGGLLTSCHTLTYQSDIWHRYMANRNKMQN